MDKDIFWDHFWIKHKVSITDHADNNVKATLPGELQLYSQTVYPNVSGTIGHVSRVTAEWVNLIIANKARLIFFFFLQENVFIFLKTDKINPIPKDRQNHSYKYIYLKSVLTFIILALRYEFSHILLFNFVQHLV